MPSKRSVSSTSSFDFAYGSAQDGDLLIKRLFDHVLDRWIGDRNIVNGKISQKPGCDTCDILCFDLDVLLFPILFILHGGAILGQIM